MRMLPRVTVLLTASAVAVVALALPAGAQVSIDAELADRDIESGSNSDPIELHPHTEIPLIVTITNDDDEPLAVRFVRLEGEALGLTFLTYDLGIRTTIPPNSSESVEVLLDFFDLDSQATGYLGTALRVYDEDRDVVAEQSFVVDVRGSATSTLGLFAITILLIAVVSVILLAVNTVRRRLPANRFVRGLQFAIAGAAIGLTLALGISILRLTFVEVEAWVPLVFLPTVIAFLVGYIAPGPLATSIEEIKEEEELDIAAEEAVARASGRYTAPEDAARVSHESGGFRTSQESGEYQPAHDSGSFTQQESGGFTPQDSGGFTPQGSGEFEPSDGESSEGGKD